MTTKLDEIRDELAQKYLIDNDLDYQKYRDKRGDRSAYNSLMNYEITGLAEDAYVAGWDAAMERSQVLVDALETMLSWCTQGDNCHIAECKLTRKALAKFRGDSQSDEVGKDIKI